MSWNGMSLTRFTAGDIAERNRQNKVLAMDKNSKSDLNRPQREYYLTIYLNGIPERSICSADQEYLAERGREWFRAGLIEDYQINDTPIKAGV